MDKGKGRTSILKTVLKESKGYPLLFISHLGTKGRDGQARLNAVLKETIGYFLLSFSPLEGNGQAGLNAGLK